MTEKEEQDLKEVEENGKAEEQTESNTEETTDENRTEETPEKEAVVVVETTNVPVELKGFRKRMAERAMRENHQCDMSKDEDYESYCNSVLDKYEDADKNLSKIFAEFPEFRSMISELNNGKPLRAVIASNFDAADLIPDASDDDYNEWEKARNERKSRREAEEAFIKEVEDNMAESNGIIDVYAVDKDYDEDKKKAIIEKVNEIAENLYKGKITPEFLDLVQKGLNFEDAVAFATQAGEIKGRNENIEAKMESESRSKKGDGIPSMQDKGYKPKMVRGKNAVINFDAIFNS